MMLPYNFCLYSAGTAKTRVLKEKSPNRLRGTTNEKNGALTTTEATFVVVTIRPDQTSPMWTCSADTCA